MELLFGKGFKIQFDCILCWSYFLPSRVEPVLDIYNDPVLDASHSNSPTRLYFGLWSTSLSKKKNGSEWCLTFFFAVQQADSHSAGPRLGLKALSWEMEECLDQSESLLLQVQYMVFTALYDSKGFVHCSQSVINSRIQCEVIWDMRLMAHSLGLEQKCFILSDAACSQRYQRAIFRTFR